MRSEPLGKEGVHRGGDNDRGAAASGVDAREAADANMETDTEGRGNHGRDARDGGGTYG